MGDADSLAALLGGPPTARAIGTADLWFTGIPVGADLGDTTEATDADLATLRADAPLPSSTRAVWRSCRGGG